MLYKNLSFKKDSNKKRINCFDFLTIGGDISNNRLIKRSFYNVPFKFKGHSLLQKSIQLIIISLMGWVLFIRGFFVTKRSYYTIVSTVPLITLSIILLSKFYTTINVDYLNLYILTSYGINLLSYDTLGSRFSHYILNSSDSILSLTTLTSLQQNPNIIKRFVVTKILNGLFIGKGVMTAGGRAVLAGAVVTGGTLMYNSYADRQAMNIRAQAEREATDRRANADREATDRRANADREATDRRANADREAADMRAETDRQAEDKREAKSRAYQNYQDARTDYRSSPFYKQKGEKPVWDDNSWQKWS